MMLICKVQEHLVLAYRGTDSGEFVFVLCRHGLEKALGVKLSIGQKFEMDVEVKFKKYV